MSPSPARGLLGCHLLSEAGITILPARAVGPVPLDRSCRSRFIQSMGFVTRTRAASREVNAAAEPTARMTGSNGSFPARPNVYRRGQRARGRPGRHPGLPCAFSHRPCSGSWPPCQLRSEYDRSCGDVLTGFPRAPGTGTVEIDGLLPPVQPAPSSGAGSSRGGVGPPTSPRVTSSSSRPRRPFHGVVPLPTGRSTLTASSAPALRVDRGASPVSAWRYFSSRSSRIFE